MQYNKIFTHILPTDNRHFIRTEMISNKLVLNG